MREGGREGREVREGGEGDVLVDDQVGGEAEHSSVTLLVGAPAQTEGHEEQPGALQQGHLVVQVKVPETCAREPASTHTHTHTHVYKCHHG